MAQTTIQESTFMIMLITSGENSSRVWVSNTK